MNDLRTTTMLRSELPVDAIVPDVKAALAKSGAVVVTAPPGSGKTTRIPPALLDDGPVLLIQPRQVAARGVARRIAHEAGSHVGERIGWQVRFERKFSKNTKLLVATEGILLARLQEDPLLSEFRTLVLDEVHERSAQMDLGFALARQVASARKDFQIVLMSATLDADLYSRALGDCPVVRADTRVHSVEVEHRDGVETTSAVHDAFQATDGHVLCFLPGVADIERARAKLQGDVSDAVIFPLHGSLRAEEQEAALSPSKRRKILLATNIAETSVTVEGVTAVVDSGLHKIMRHDLRTGLDRLCTERISADSATQRSGRAGRTQPGRAIRLWHPSQKLRPQREPEILRIDLAPTLLELLAWSEDPRDFAWLEAPSEGAIERGLALLESLGAVVRGKLTAIGEQMRRLPMPPRLGRVLIEAGGGRRASELCALLAEDPPLGRGLAPTTDSDPLARLRETVERSRSIRRAADQIARVADRLPLQPQGADQRTPPDSDEALRRALLAGFADRLARRREPGSDRLLLASGHGGRLAQSSGVREGEWLVAVTLRAGRRGQGEEARVESASRVDRDWLPEPTESIEHEYDSTRGRVRAWRRQRLGALLVEEAPVDVDPASALSLLREAMTIRIPSQSERRLRARADVAGLTLDFAELAESLLMGAVSMPKLDFLPLLHPQDRKSLDRHAPERLRVPSGRQHQLDYRDDGEVILAVKLQELFGLEESPCVGNPPRPVTLSLLAPNGRPVQTTRDLRNFWSKTYPEVRREMRGRYAKHPWPEDPWAAAPTARAKPRREGK